MKNKSLYIARFPCHDWRFVLCMNWLLSSNHAMIPFCRATIFPVAHSKLCNKNRVTILTQRATISLLCVW